MEKNKKFSDEIAAAIKLKVVFGKSLEEDPTSAMEQYLSFNEKVMAAFSTPREIKIIGHSPRRINETNNEN